MEGGPKVKKDRWSNSTKVYVRRNYKKGSKLQDSSQTLASEDGNISSLQQQEPPPVSRLDLASDDSTSLRKAVVETLESHVNIHVSAMSRREIREIKEKLVGELGQVRDLLRQVEEKEVQVNGFSVVDVVVEGGIVGVDCDDGLIDVDVLDEVDVGGEEEDIDDDDEEEEVDVGDGSLDHTGARRLVLDATMDDGGRKGGGLDNGSGRRMVHPEFSLENGRERRVVHPEFSLENVGGRRVGSEFNLENGGGRSVVSEFSLEDGGEGRMIPEFSLENGGGRMMIPEFSLEDGVERRMIPEFSLEDGGERRMIPEFSLEDGGERRMIPEFSLENGGGRRMIPVARMDSSGGRRMGPEINLNGKREPPRSLQQLRVSVMEKNLGGLSEYVDKEKRTPKANQFYRNSDFIVGKEKFPPPSKKQKTYGSKKHGRFGERASFGLIKHTSQVFKNCSSLLTKLMKHKHGWVFNAPVDVDGLGLHDYFIIIKHPMDLGTVKTRLNTNWYRSPREFSEDVRLTFLNAMTYNPKGQDVHIMAEQLSHIFEERWAVMEAEYNLDSWYELYDEVIRPTPMVSRAPLPEIHRSYDRLDSTPQPAHSKPNSVYRGSYGRGTALKKPKAKDLNKRNMTYEEKQKLSTNLQNLPSEKQDSIVEIIKRRAAPLSQSDDQIEVDIDSFDVETLWELDRFVTNYKKSLSKYKRKAELAMQARQNTERYMPAKNQTPSMIEVSKEAKIDEKSTGLPQPHQADKQQENGSRSSSSSSSGSDSTSSSSDSDSDSSSESDAGHSPKT